MKLAQYTDVYLSVTSLLSTSDESLNLQLITPIPIAKTIMNTLGARRPHSSSNSACSSFATIVTMPTVMPRKLARAFHGPFSPITVSRFPLSLEPSVKLRASGVRYVTKTTSSTRQMPIPALRKPSAWCKELRT